LRPKSNKSLQIEMFSIEKQEFTALDILKAF